MRAEEEEMVVVEKGDEVRVDFAAVIELVVEVKVKFKGVATEEGVATATTVESK